LFKKYKNIILSSSIFIILLTVFFSLKYILPEKKEENQVLNQENKTDALIELAKSDIKEIQEIIIKNKDSEFEIIKNLNEDKIEYSVTGLETGQEVNQGSAENVFKKFSNFIAKKIVLEKTEDLTQFGLENPRAEIIVNYTEESGKESKIFFLGADVDFSSDSYLKLKDDDKIYLVSFSEKSVFLSAKKDYVKKEENN